MSYSASLRLPASVSFLICFSVSLSIEGFKQKSNTRTPVGVSPRLKRPYEFFSTGGSHFVFPLKVTLTKHYFISNLPSFSATDYSAAKSKF